MPAPTSARRRSGGGAVALDELGDPTEEARLGEAGHCAELPPGAFFDGPAIVEEFGSTVPVHPGFVATVDRFGNLLLVKEPA